jgi:predicted hotdog family 3-hydroxylacyl-ACP dehydratase
MTTPRIELEALVPHRRPMLLISEIIAFDDQSAATRSVVGRDWPLVGPDGVNALILIELVAQTAAINNGWELFKRDGPGTDRRGWIVGIKSARFRIAAIAPDTTIRVESVNQFAYDNFREIQGIAKIEGKPVAEVLLQLMQAEPLNPSE